MEILDIKKLIRNVENFPKEGVNFKDITTVLNQPEYFKSIIENMQNDVKDIDFDVIVAAESRGFIFASALCYSMGKGFVPVRKPGKLPYKTIKQEYKLEYSEGTLEMHADAIKENQKVLVLDDVLATGGTARAMSDMVQVAGGKVVGFSFFIEIEDLKGKDLLDKPVYSLIKY